MIDPTRQVVSEFDGCTRPMLRKQEINFDESQTLAAIRDALLPKLLSGEIRVEAAEKIVEEVA